MDFIRKGGGSGNKGSATGEKDDIIKVSDMSNFGVDVIETSRKIPVVVDMWAPWCGPCRTLGPILEKLVRQSGGRVRMVKINVDENQKLAAQLGVASIPAVFAFKNGVAVDGFIGALSEGQIKAFINRVVGNSSDVLDQLLAEAASSLKKGNIAAAEKLYNQILEKERTHAVALSGLIECLITRGDTKTAHEILRNLPADVLKKKEILSVKTRLELTDEVSNSTEKEDELKEKIQANPNNHQARYDLAMSYYAVGEREKAVDELLEIIQRDRSWNNDGARKQLIRLFEAFGTSDALTVQSRRRLSLIMFS